MNDIECVAPVEPAFVHFNIKGPVIVSLLSLSLPESFKTPFISIS